MLLEQSEDKTSIPHAIPFDSKNIESLSHIRGQMSVDIALQSLDRISVTSQSPSALKRRNSTGDAGTPLSISHSPGNATSSSPRRPARQKSEREVLVGTPVKEGHVNYLLMYDMLTGIRISVSRCSAKIARELTAGDFTAAHKLAFDVYTLLTIEQEMK
jgi:hypothetical protein